MAGKKCELCRLKIATQKKFGIELCDECSEGYSAVFRGDKAAIEKYSNSSKFPEASIKAYDEIISFASRKKSQQTDFVCEPLKKTKESIKVSDETISLTSTEKSQQTDFVCKSPEEINLQKKIYTELILIRKDNAQAYADIEQMAKDVHFFKILVVIWLCFVGSLILLPILFGIVGAIASY